MEIWKDIKGYEGLYKISNLGNLKSLNYKKRGSEKLIKWTLDKEGYLRAGLCKNGKRERVKGHQLVAITFLNHKRCGVKLVVNHINHIKSDNRVENLEIITNRENCNHRKKAGTSAYPGVCWDKSRGKWKAQVHINNKTHQLGRFANEYDAHLAYEKALCEIK